MWTIYILYIFFSISSPSSVAHVFHFFLLPCWLVIFAIQPRASLGKITDVFSEENSYSILYILFWLCLKFIFLLLFLKISLTIIIFYHLPRDWNFELSCEWNCVDFAVGRKSVGASFELNLSSHLTDICKNDGIFIIVTSKV